VSEQEEQEDDTDGQYAFKRKRGCSYHSPLIDRLGNWPWTAPHEGVIGDRKYRFCLTSISQPKPRCIGFARRRYGRGGRYESTYDFILIQFFNHLIIYFSLILDRAFTPLDIYWSEFSRNSIPNGFPNEFLNEIKNEWYLMFSK